MVKPPGVHHGHANGFNPKTACGLDAAGVRTRPEWRGLTCQECQRRDPGMPAELRLPGYQAALCCGDPQR